MAFTNHDLAHLHTADLHREAEHVRLANSITPRRSIRLPRILALHPLKLGTAVKEGLEWFYSPRPVVRKNRIDGERKQPVC